MPHNLYQQTMEQLSQSLEKKWQIPVKYTTESLLHNEKWLKTNNEVIFPLSIDSQTAGQIKISADLNEEQIAHTYNLIQWTLLSLFHIFKEHDTSFYTGSKEIYPLLIQSHNTKLSLQKAYEIYEQSSALSFIHCHASVLDKNLFSTEMDKTLIFISEAQELSRKNQLFLAHFIRSSLKDKKHPMIIASANVDLSQMKKNSKILPSFIESFVSFQLNDIH